MNDKIHFVTAIFNGLYNHKDFNGRMNRDRWYAESLNNLQSMNATFDLYGTSKDFKTLDEFNLPNVNKIETSLYDLPFHDDIQRIIPKNLECPIQRSHHVMYGKFEWLKLSCKNMDDNDYIFWIDAGLSNRGTFPDKCSTLIDGDITKFDEYCKIDKIFDERLPIALKSTSKEQILCIESYLPEGITTIDIGYYGINEIKVSGNIIAGLFGGRVNVMKKMISLFEKLQSRMFNDDKLYHEELLMTMVANIMYDDIKLLKFMSWYHENTIHAPNTSVKSFADVFMDDLGIRI